MRTFVAAAALAGVASAVPYNKISDYIRGGIGGDPALHDPVSYSLLPTTTWTAVWAPVSTSIANASSSTSTSTASSTPSVEPCLLVSRQVSNQTAKYKYVDPQLAYDCLRSVPLDLANDLKQLEGVKVFTQFQSTLAYLESPPEGYLYPAVDIMGGLDQLANKLNDGFYTNEYDFQIDLYDLVQSGYDEHFNYYPDITQIFSFLRFASLYSVSKHPQALPEVYLTESHAAITNSLFLTSYNNSVSPIAQINGVDVETWLNGYASMEGTAQDPDTNYNSVFASVPGAGVGSFTGSLHWQGLKTMVTFKNGTSSTLKHYAATSNDFTGVKDGATFFQKFCQPTGASNDDFDASSGSSSSSSTTDGPVIPTTEVPFEPVPSQTANLGPDYYPIPYIINDDNSVVGYFPTEHQDTAVLSIPSFKPADETQFSNVVRQFLASALAARKTKLVIDLRGNGGGEIMTAYDTFAQLFPFTTPYGATNFRATPLFNDLGTIISGFYSNVTNDTVPNSYCNGENNFFAHPFNYRELYTMNNTDFTSWQDLYGPEYHHGDRFTSQTRYDLNDKFSVFCTNISNYGNLARITPQVFQPEDILIIQDGACASTCAIFSEFMKGQAGVKSVVFGGRKQTGPMQAVGGVKGANVWPMSSIHAIIKGAYTENSTPEQQLYLRYTYGNLTEPMGYALARASGSDGARLNSRNNIRLGDESVTPLQFVYEAADCRLFYTSAMLQKQSLVWKVAYDWYWGNGTCVEGSEGQASSGVSVDIAPPDSARNFFGADRVSSYPLDLTS